MSFDTSDLRHCPSCGDQRWTDEHLADTTPKICRECGYTERRCTVCREFFAPETDQQTACDECNTIPPLMTFEQFVRTFTPPTDPQAP